MIGYKYIEIKLLLSLITASSKEKKHQIFLYSCPCLAQSVVTQHHLTNRASLFHENELNIRRIALVKQEQHDWYPAAECLRSCGPLCSFSQRFPSVFANCLFPLARRQTADPGRYRHQQTDQSWHCPARGCPLRKDRRSETPVGSEWK